MPKTQIPLRGALLSLACLVSTSAYAANVISNPGFEDSSGAWPPVAPVSWTYYGPGENFYIESNQTAPKSGKNSFKIWGTEWNTGATNMTGIYQSREAKAGWIYAANAWFKAINSDLMGPDNRLWVEVSFRDASGNPLKLFRTIEFGRDIGLDEWHNLAVTNAIDLETYAPTGAVTQLVAPAGTATVRCQIVHYQANNGGGAGFVDDVVLDQLVGPVPPVLSNVSPGNLLLHNASAGISFTVSSPSSTTIPNSGIKLSVNGTDVSSALSITGTDTSKQVTYSGLESNKTYTATIDVTDAEALNVNRGIAFDTLSPNFVWEAEDYDFDGGQYIQNPVLANAPGNPDSYFGKVGVAGTDFNDVSGGDGDHLYRATDAMATTTAGDVARTKFGTSFTDYKVGWFNGGEWVNYTRNYPSGKYNIYGRLAGGAGAATGTLSKIENGTPVDLGIFTFVGTGWNAFQYVPLTDSNNNVLEVTLGGVQTLRLTTGGGIDPNFLMLVPAVENLPKLADIYPNGSTPMQATNRLAFTVTAPAGAVQNSGIKLWLNGTDVSSQLQISGSGGTQTVIYPNLTLNAIYSSVISVTNTTGGGVSRTNTFDTFSQSNLIVEAEDFDYDNGKFFDDPVPNAYISLAGVAEVDYHHTTADGEQFAYRPGLPNEVAGDWLRDAFRNTGATDYNIGWFGNGDWANYTRTYPAGNYFVYGRFAGSGGYSMYLDKVTSGAGTSTQTTQRLGRFGAVGRGWQTYDWVPLMDESLGAPVVVSLSGKTTLRLTTTGSSNPSFIMLVPASGINVTTSLSETDVSIGFATQPGAGYRVFYKTELTGSWTLLKAGVATGSTTVVTDPIGPGMRFYKVVSP